MPSTTEVIEGLVILDNAISIGQLRNTNNELKDQLNNIKSEVSHLKDLTKLSTQMNLELLEHTLLLPDEYVQRLEQIAQFDLTNQKIRFKLAENYFKLGKYQEAYTSINYFKSWTDTSISIDSVHRLHIKILYALSLKKDSLEDRLEQIIKCFSIFSNIQNKNDTKYLEIKEQITNDAMALYNQASHLLNNQLIPYARAVKIWKYLQSLHINLTDYALPIVNDINDYPIKITADSIIKICHEITTQYKNEIIGSLFATTKNKVSLLNKACETAKNALVDSQGYVELKSFLNYKLKNEDYSLLEALQMGRWGSSGPDVSSFQSFIEKLNQSHEGQLGDIIAHMQSSKQSSTSWQLPSLNCASCRS